nr:MAG TPA: hypothetical protein [Caudoviricetes sp.]
MNRKEKSFVIACINNQVQANKDEINKIKR